MLFPWDEVNTLEQKWTMPFQERITAKEVIDEIYDILVLAYVYGWDNVVKDLGVSIEVDTDKAVASIERPVAGKTFTDRVNEYVGEVGELTEENVEEVIRIVETETNRVFNEGGSDAADAAEEEAAEAKPEEPKKPEEGVPEAEEPTEPEKETPNPEETTTESSKDESGRRVMKRWHTMEDERVRDTHFYLEGTVIPKNEKFHTFDGDEARYPGDFMLPQNVINCRCYVEYFWGK